MKNFLFLILLLVFMNPAKAAVSVVDVSSPWGGTKEFSASYGQTFTPLIGGNLDTLRLYVVGWPQGSSLTASVWSYDSETGKLGAVLGSQVYTSSVAFAGGYGWVELNFHPNILLTAGKTMAFTVSQSAGSGHAISSSSVYSEGAYFEYPGSNSITLTNRDLAFQTLVSPVPEPGTPLIASSVVVMLGLIRRKSA